MDTRTERLGLATQLVCSTPRLVTRSIAYIRRRVQPAILHDQIYFAFGERGDALAFWIWAFVAPDVEARLARDPEVVLHESEWNEGSNLWILDLVAPYGHARDVIHFIRHRFLPECTEAMSARSKADGRIKVTKWRRSVSCPKGSCCMTTPPRFTLPPNAFSASHTDWLRGSNTRPHSEIQSWLRRHGGSQHWDRSASEA